MIRTIAATFIAPLWALLFSALFMGMIVPELGSLFPPDRPLYRAAMWASMGLVMAYIPMVALAGPIHLALRKMKRQSLSAYVAAWLVMSFLQWGIIHVVSLMVRHPDLGLSLMLADLLGNIDMPISFSPAWMLSGATFWLIARPGGRHQRLEQS